MQAPSDDLMSDAKLIVGWEDAQHSSGALELGALLARLLEATLLLVHVFPARGAPFRGGAAGEAARRERAEELLREAEELGKGEDSETLALPARSPAQGLHDLAERRGAQGIAVGSSGRGPLGRVLAGDTARALLHEAPCPVAVAPNAYTAPAGGLNAIGVAFDGERESELALEAAGTLALRAGATLQLLAVAEPPGLSGTEAIVGVTYESIMEETREELREAIEKALGALPDSLQAGSQVLEGHAADELAGAARGLDLLVTGSRGYGPLGRVLLGSTSARLADSAPCPLFVVPRGGTATP